MWFNIVATLANENYLMMDTVLDSNVEDCFIFLTYLTEKNKAQRAQQKFEENLRKSRKHK